MTSRQPLTLPPLFQSALQPLRSFFQLEAASGLLLAASAVIALAWANSPWAEGYRALFEAPLALEAAGARGAFTLGALINDGLMTFFFFVVGLEIKKELSGGELRTPARALLPLVAALGGMVVPAGLYLLTTAGTPAARGWAIPMATDIAFAIGCVTLLKGRIPHALVVFLTALAIFDDIGGILVIALFYGTGLHASWLFGALGLLVALYGLNRFYVRSGLAYLLAGAALWYCMHHGGVHATLAGVVVGMMVPALPVRRGRDVLEDLSRHTQELLDRPEDEDVRSEQLVAIEERLEELEPPLHRFLHACHLPVAYGVVPLFALANSGISLSGMTLADLLLPLPLGILLGLFVGKQLGIFAFTWLAVRAKLSSMPGNAGLRQLHGVSVVAGIGFTVALFVAGLAFAEEPTLLTQAKLGILVGSFLSAVVGYGLLRSAPSRAMAQGR